MDTFFKKEKLRPDKISPVQLIQYQYFNPSGPEC